METQKSQMEQEGQVKRIEKQGEQKRSQTIESALLKQVPS